MTLDVLVVTGGHPFEPEPFFAMFDAFEDIDWTATEDPEVGHDVVVLYDMPGFAFTGDAQEPVRFSEPTDEQRSIMHALTAAGTGLVFLHHAVAGWPTSDLYGDLVAARFHYQPASWRGVDYPDSGYLLDVEHRIEVVATDHPVCAGLPHSFSLTDELYCFPVDEAAVTPLLRTTHPTSADHYFSPDHAIRGRMHDRTGWTHPDGSALVGWARTAQRSRVVYLQPGDGPTSYGDANYRRLLDNAMWWSARTERA